MMLKSVFVVVSVAKMKTKVINLNNLLNYQILAKKRQTNKNS